MKKKKLKKFIHLFDSLTTATHIADEWFNPSKYKNDNHEPDEDSILELRIISHASSLCIFRDDPVLKEIEKNLYKLTPDERIIYVQDIIRMFYVISPFFNLESFNKESSLANTHNICSSIINNHDHYIELLNASSEFVKSGDISIVNIAKMYLHNCYNLYYDFFLFFDALCLSFNMDLVELQSKMNVIVYTKKDRLEDILEEMGYKNKKSDSKEIPNLPSLLETSLDSNEKIGYASKTNSNPLYEKLEEFLGLFDCLDFAIGLMLDRNNELPEDPEWKELKEIQFKIRTESVERGLEKFDKFYESEAPNLLTDLILQIEQNLYTFNTENRLIYIKYILRQFIKVSKYFNPKSIHSKSENHYSEIKACRTYVKRLYKEYLYEDELPDPENCIFNCVEAFRIFFKYFDAKCLDFGIDLMEVQKEMNICVYSERDMCGLQHLGYENIPSQIQNKQNDSFDHSVKLITKSIIPPITLISFDSPETIDKLYKELKGPFGEQDSKGEQESKLKKALNGEKLNEPLIFPHNGNKFVEVFKRVKYNGYLLSTPTEIRDWICACFMFRYKRGEKTEIKPFNKSTVWDILTKDKDPIKKERICNVDWLPYKNHETLKKEAEKEKL